MDEFEKVLIAFRDNASKIQKEFGIEGSIIPMSFIINDQDPGILINGFGEGYGDADKDRHIAVTDDQKVICSATQEKIVHNLLRKHRVAISHRIILFHKRYWTYQKCLPVAIMKQVMIKIQVQ